MESDFRSDAPVTSIDLRLLRSGTPGITPAFGEALAQAAVVCLEDQDHTTGTPISVDGDYTVELSLIWEPATSQVRRCWADYDVATEHGAYGVAAVLVGSLTDLTIVERSRRGSGFDYWLGRQSADASDSTLFQHKARLEVSGIRAGTERDVAERMRRKVIQTTRSDGQFPAIVVVVEFSSPRSRIIAR